MSCKNCPFLAGVEITADGELELSCYLCEENKIWDSNTQNSCCYEDIENLCQEFLLL